MENAQGRRKIVWARAGLWRGGADKWDDDDDDFDDELDKEEVDKESRYLTDRLDPRRVNRALASLAAGSYDEALDANSN